MNLRDKNHAVVFEILEQTKQILHCCKSMCRYTQNDVAIHKVSQFFLRLPVSKGSTSMRVNLVKVSKRIHLSGPWSS